MDEERVDLRTKILIGVISVLILAIGGFGVWLVLGNKSAKVILPDFKGQTVSQVRAWAGANKVSEEQITFEYVYDEETPADVVIAQEPAAKTNLKKKTLTLTVSQGAEPGAAVALPDFTGMTRSEIENWFQSHNFTNVNFVGEKNDLPAGTLISITPFAAELDPDTAVTVVISEGPEQETATSTGTDVTVPDFSTYDRAAVTNWANANNVKILIHEEANRNGTKGLVMTQSPAAGSTISYGDTVRVTICMGDPVTLVSQIGKTRTDAEKWISDSKLTGKYVEVYNDAAKGQIVSMDPPQGIVYEGAPITFGVSVGQPTVPFFTGGMLDDAQATINTLNSQYSNSANINLVVDYKDGSQPVGTILYQMLNGNAQYVDEACSPGSTVTLQVCGGAVVENYAGYTEDAFLKTLSNLGVGPGERYEEYSDSVAAGSIIWNETGRYTKGTTVNYTVSIGPMYATEEQPQG